MEILHKSNYYEILFDQSKSLIVHKALNGSSEMSDQEFKQEMHLFLEMCEKYSPERDLVHLVDMNYPIVPDIQEWVNNEIFPRLLIVVKRMALVMPSEMVAELAIEQTMEEEEGKKFVSRYFSDENQALEWLIML